MAVQSLGQTMDGKGFEKSHKAFLMTHRENTAVLLNLAEGLPEDGDRPIYDPSHVDNQWPLMLHHAVYGELTVGNTLKGIKDVSERRATIEQNAKDKKAALAQGYRLEPFAKVQIAVLDAASEKAAVELKNRHLEGQLVSLQDQLSKMGLLIEQLTKSQAA